MEKQKTGPKNLDPESKNQQLAQKPESSIEKPKTGPTHLNPEWNNQKLDPKT